MNLLISSSAIPLWQGLGEAALASAIAGGWLNRDAIVVLEERANIDLELPAPLEELDRRKAGETQLIFGRFAG